MRIALDAMGSDRAPGPEIEGAVSVLSANPDLEIVLVGQQDVIEKELRKYKTAGLSFSIHHAPDVIEMGESPSKALKAKPNSSLVQCIGLQKAGKVGASISAGNTGALMGASLFVLGRIEKVLRPGIGVLMPTVSGFCFVLDVGANSDNRPAHLFQFARMGEIFMERVWDKKSPRIGLLSVGSESTKGNEAVVAAHAMLRESNMNFVGNVEGNGILFDKADVVVCDGFVGNVLLKFYEAIPKMLKQTLGDLLSGERAEKFLEKFNSETYGAADLMGVNGVVLKCHGGSTATAIRAGILKAGKMVDCRINDIIKTVLAKDPALVE
jgi:phosphate acyltransferase